MNFTKVFIILAVICLIMLPEQAQAGWLKKIGKKLEGVGKRTRNAAVQGIAIAQQAANVAATARG